VSVVCGDDSILVIGGDNSPGQQSGTVQAPSTVFDSTNWFLFKEHTTIQGPRMLSRRGRFCAAKSELAIDPCQIHGVVFAFGGINDVGSALDSCEMLDLGIKGTGSGFLSGSSLEHLA